VYPKWPSEPEERAKLFRQNVSSELERLEWTRSAAKHRVSKLRIRHALERCALVLGEDPPDHSAGRDRRWIFLGEDQEGIALEVIAVENDEGKLLIIHAMEMRRRYRRVYREVRRWTQ